MWARSSWRRLGEDLLRGTASQLVKSALGKRSHHVKPMRRHLSLKVPGIIRAWLAAEWPCHWRKLYFYLLCRASLPPAPSRLCAIRKALSRGGVMHLAPSYRHARFCVRWPRFIFLSLAFIHRLGICIPEWTAALRSSYKWWNPKAAWECYCRNTCDV